MISLLIADDHPLFRSALTGALRDQLGEVEIQESHDLESTLGSLKANPDVDL